MTSRELLLLVEQLTDEETIRLIKLMFEKLREDQRDKLIEDLK